MLSKNDWIIPSGGMEGLLLLVICASFMVSCRKDEGTGGTGSITGRVVESFYNDDFSLKLYEERAVDEEVFIFYGQDNTLGDRTFTGYSGQFRFDYLYPGKYIIQYRSQDTTSLQDDDEFRLRIVTLDRGEDLDLGELPKYTSLDFDDGTAVIKGVVKVIDYVDESQWPNLIIDYIAPALEQEVYLTYGNHSFYDERIRTQHDGYFEFSKLIPGDYLIFLYSEDVTGSAEHVALKFEVTIAGFDQVVDLGVINIEKL
jgi:hypothetical protein